MKLFWSFTFFILYTHIITAQLSLRQLSQQLLNKLPQEKVYLMFNKTNYYTGEPIFFNAFAVMADNHKTDSLSGILYVDILDSQTNRVMSHKILPLVEGLAHGSIETDSLKEDITIVAYTRWMLNFSPQYFYNRTIPIQPLTTNIDKTTESISDSFNVSFFPEGGNMVIGLASRIAVKSIDKYGKGINIEGTIFDETGATIETFNTSKEGFGSFIFKPVLHETYVVKVSTEKSETRIFQLPLPILNGFTLFADVLTEGDKVSLNIQTNLPDAQMPNSLLLIAHTRGLINWGTKLDIKDKSNKTFFIEFPRNKLTYDGIVHLTLFNDAGIPLCERLFFNENLNQRLNVVIKTDKEKYGFREKVIVNIVTKDRSGLAVKADLSLAVIDVDKVFQNVYGENILSYMLLRSDLGNEIEKPYFAFKDTSLATRQYMDLLLMTVGWRRFTWQKLLDTVSVPPQYFPENGLTLKGYIFDKKKPLINRDVLLTLVENHTQNQQSLLVMTDSVGNFWVDNLDFEDTTVCTINVLNNKKNYDFKILQNKSIQNSFHFRGYSEQGSLRVLSYLEQSIGLELANIKLNNNKSIVLDTFTVKDKQLKKRDARAFQYDKPNASVRIDPASTANSRNIVEYLNGREGLKMFVTAQGNVVIQPLRGNISLSNIRGMTADNTPTVLIDGQPATPQDLLTIPLSEVEKADVIRSANPLFGIRGGNGIINILTKTGKGIGSIRNNINSRDDKFPQTQLKGFSLVKEFYTTDYSNFKVEHDRLDYRSSIYWNHSIKTDEKGMASLIFYNPDDTKKVRIIVEGLTKDGKIGVQFFEYSISIK